MKTDTLFDDLVAEIRDDLQRADAATDGVQAPTTSFGLFQGLRATHALTEVLQALGDLQPDPALIVTDAIERGLDVRR